MNGNGTLERLPAEQEAASSILARRTTDVRLEGLEQPVDPRVIAAREIRSGSDLGKRLTRDSQSSINQARWKVDLLARQARQT